MERILIFVSNIATILGRMLPFKRQSEGVLAWWERHPTYKEAELRYKSRTAKTAEEIIIAQAEVEIQHVREKVDKIIESRIEILKDSHHSEGIKELDSEVEILLQCVPKEVATIVEKSIKSHVTMELGKLRESVVQVEIKSKDGNKEFFKRYFDENWGFGGKIDGFDEEGNIDEIKNRRYKIKDMPPEYDLIQTGGYLWTLKKEVARLTEQLITTGETKRTFITLHSEKDIPGAIVIDELWDNCMKEMTLLVPRLQQFLIDPVKQDAFLLLMKEGKVKEADLVF